MTPDPDPRDLLALHRRIERLEAEVQRLARIIDKTEKEGGKK